MSSTTRTIDPFRLNKLLFVGYLDRYKPDEGRVSQQSKQCDNVNKHEVNSLNANTVEITFHPRKSDRNFNS